MQKSAPAVAGDEVAGRPAAGRRSSLRIGDRLVAALPCPVCLGADRRLIGTVGRDGAPLDTVICDGCGLIHSDPIPSAGDLAAYYAAEYRRSCKSAERPKRKHVLRCAQGALARVEAIERNLEPGRGRWLDVGAGGGEFVYLARRRGADARGVEPHHGYAAHAREALGLPVETGTIETLGIAPGSLDAINLDHLLEHLPDPLAALTRLHGWLDESGILAVAVPDASRLRHAPRNRFHVAHIYNFGPRTLAALARKAGFDILEGEGTTSLVLRKARPPRPDLALPMPQEAAALRLALAERSAPAHYLSPTPWTRLLRKAVQYPWERLRLLRLGDAAEILEASLAAAKGRRAPSRRSARAPSCGAPSSGVPRGVRHWIPRPPAWLPRGARCPRRRFTRADEAEAP